MAFPRKRNFGQKLADASNFNNDACRSYAEYVRDKHEKLKRLKANWSPGDMIDAIVFTITDPVVRMTVTNSNCRSIPELITVLSSFPLKDKSRRCEDSGASTVKKRRISPDRNQN